MNTRVRKRFQGIAYYSHNSCEDTRYLPYLVKPPTTTLLSGTPERAQWKGEMENGKQFGSIQIYPLILQRSLVHVA